ncbi:hypothetical protein T01_10466 [Trichinella spiralis]|uniref:Uncharacterized protein n=1 Tax=Trichinella spiralis TaxID=6334 RepID=A0A0V1AMQ8_TRISP|nr:hypothetical protein T01_384 [Trichinella spiralis]KRY25833.1 hypothetical protein T01_10466 [Trichinella spiralis]
MFIDSIDYALQGETMGMHKAVSKQDGIVEVPEETDFSGITSLNKTVPFKILCLRIICKYMPSGYAWGYASGKSFKKIAAGYAPGYASGKLYANICPQAMLGAMPPAKFS